MPTETKKNHKSAFNKNVDIQQMSEISARMIGFFSVGISFFK